MGHDNEVDEKEKKVIIPFQGKFSLDKSEGSVHEILRKQMDGKSYLKLNETGSICMIPGENPDVGMLCGTNVYAIGTGQKRYLVDACVNNHKKFIDNIKSFLD
jgi:hypothetical protein